MTPSVLHRIRWGNVARLAGAAAALALVVAWPSLRPREPPLPPAAAVPVPQGGAPVTGGERDEEPREARGRRKRRATRAPARRAPRAHRPRHRVPERTTGGEPGSPPAVGPTPTVARRPAPPTTPADPAAEEFSFG